MGKAFLAISILVACGVLTVSVAVSDRATAQSSREGPATAAITTQVGTDGRPIQSVSGAREGNGQETDQLSAVLPHGRRVNPVPLPRVYKEDAPLADRFYY